MARYDDQIRELNPWWRAPSAVAEDPHLTELARSRVAWDPPTLAAVPLVPGSVHTLRGPRQVGKSTTVKRFIRRLVEAGERRVLYFSFDLERRNKAIRDVVMRAKRLHPDPRGPWFIFLDEVTSIANWQLGIKYLWDNGAIRDDLVVCTGSSARKMGAEQLPGRRGNGRDFVHLPMSFRAFCQCVADVNLPTETVAAEEWLTPAGERLARELNLQAETLADATDLYVRVGGFPAAVRDHMTHGAISESTIRMLWEIIAGDIQESGYDKHSALRLMERIGIGLGSPIAWDTLRKAMDVGSHNTAKAYTHLLSESFMLLTIFHWAQGGAFEPERQRKVYFVDPLLAQIAPALMPGGRRPNDDGLYEGIIAAGLYASAAHRVTLADPLPGAVGYWKSSDGRETDFVVPSPASGIQHARVPVEVKGDSKRRISGARLSMRRTFGKGIIVTRKTFDQDEIPALPMGVFLAGLAPRSERQGADL
jgi:hypothetical protein